MIQLAEVVDQEIAKNDIGEVIEGESIYTPVKVIRITEITPFSSANVHQAYGFEVDTSFRCFSYDEIDPPAHLRVNGEIYFVRETAKYPKVRALLLERV
jgi:hypothetical protein